MKDSSEIYELRHSSYGRLIQSDVAVRCVCVCVRQVVVENAVASSGLFAPSSDLLTGVVVRVVDAVADGAMRARRMSSSECYNNFCTSSRREAPSSQLNQS